MSKETLPKSCENYAFCNLEISKVQDDGFELNLGQFGQISRDLNMSEHSLSQFIDIATSQAVFFAGDEHITYSTSISYLLDHVSYNFPQELTYFQDTDTYLSYGARKGVRFIEGPSQGGCAASVVVETKKTPFHTCSNLTDKAMHFVHNLDNIKDSDLFKLNKFIKGKFIYYVYIFNNSIVFRLICRDKTWKI